MRLMDCSSSVAHGRYGQRRHQRQYPALGLDATQKFPRLHQSEYTRDRRNAAECHHYSPAQGDRADGDNGALGYWAWRDRE
jgi:hypothetical protein